MAEDLDRTTKPGATDAADDAVWNVLKGNWNQLKGKVREKWGLLTGDDIEHIAGHKDRLIGKLQERYGKAKLNQADVERELRNL